MVERGPEKAGVGGSIPSLGTFPSIIWQAKKAGIKGHFPECALFVQISTSRMVQKLDCAVPVNASFLLAQLKRFVVEIQDHRVQAAFEPFLKYFNAPIVRP